MYRTHLALLASLLYKPRASLLHFAHQAAPSMAQPPSPHRARVIAYYERHNPKALRKLERHLLDIEATGKRSWHEYTLRKYGVSLFPEAETDAERAGREFDERLQRRLVITAWIVSPIVALLCYRGLGMIHTLFCTCA